MSKKIVIDNQGLGEKRKAVMRAKNFSRLDWSAHLKMVKKNYKPGTYDYLESLTGGITTIEALTKCEISMAELRMLLLIQRDFHYGKEEAGMVTLGLKNFFEKHGFITREEGIGWAISCKEAKP